MNESRFLNEEDLDKKKNQKIRAFFFHIFKHLSTVFHEPHTYCSLSISYVKKINAIFC